MTKLKGLEIAPCTDENDEPAIGLKVKDFMGNENALIVFELGKAKDVAYAILRTAHAVEMDALRERGFQETEDDEADDDD